MKCMHADCPNEATCAPKLMVPATDYALEVHQPLGLTLGVTLCDDHIGTVDAAEIVAKNPAITKIFEIMARGKQPPDFARAYIQKIGLDSDEFKTLHDANERNLKKQAEAKGDEAAPQTVIGDAPAPAPDAPKPTPSEIN